MSEHLLWSEGDRAFPHCSFANCCFAAVQDQMGLGMGRVSILIPAGFILGALPWDSPPHIPSQVWIKPAGLKILMCVCPWCCRQIRSKIPAELLLLELGSSMGRFQELPAACPLAALTRLCFQLNPKTPTRLW